MTLGNSLELRLRKLEDGMSRPVTRAANQKEQERLQDERWGREGTCREEIIAKYGSIPEWAYAEMLGPPGAALPAEPDDGLTPEERYLAMLG